MKKKILDVATKNWSKEDIQKIIPHLKKYKYKVTFELPNGKIRYAYTNDEPTLTGNFMKAMNAKILQVVEL